MEKKILSDGLVAAIHVVADLIKADSRHSAIVAASNAYSTNEELTKLLEEYNAAQSAIAAEYQNETPDDAAVKALQDRMNEIYDAVTGHPVYVKFREASEDYEVLTNEVYAELEYAVTGHRHTSDCTHDCSTCGGCH